MAKDIHAFAEFIMGQAFLQTGYVKTARVLHKNLQNKIAISQELHQPYSTIKERLPRLIALGYLYEANYLYYGENKTSI